MSRSNFSSGSEVSKNASGLGVHRSSTVKASAENVENKASNVLEKMIYVRNNLPIGYLRNNKALHTKRLRCFPFCLDEGHCAQGFCGNVIVIDMYSKRYFFFIYCICFCYLIIDK